MVLNGRAALQHLSCAMLAPGEVIGEGVGLHFSAKVSDLPFPGRAFLGEGRTCDAYEPKAAGEKRGSIKGYYGGNY